jgi:hypothetical protein
MVVAQGRDVEPAGSMVALMHSRSNLVLGCPAAGARVELAGPIYPGPIPGIPPGAFDTWTCCPSSADWLCQFAPTRMTGGAGGPPPAPPAVLPPRHRRHGHDLAALAGAGHTGFAGARWPVRASQPQSAGRSPDCRSCRHSSPRYRCGCSPFQRLESQVEPRSLVYRPDQAGSNRRVRTTRLPRGSSPC